MRLRLFAFLFLCLSPGASHAGEIMFEGYYRLEIENKPIGYQILRYEFDAKTSNFVAFQFTRAKFGDKMVQESLKAVATNKFHPVEYHYTASVDNKLKAIDATFKGDIMTLKKTDGKELRTETYKNLKGTFLSSFLPYMILTREDLAVNLAFKYSAVAEEDGNASWGKVWLQAKESKPGYDVYTLANDYENEKFFSKMAIVKDAKNPKKNIKGEVLSISSPAKNLTGLLVASPSEATEGQMVPNKVLLTLFGTVPTGKVNLIAKADHEQASSPSVKDTAPSAADEPALIPEPAPEPQPAPGSKGK